LDEGSVCYLEHTDKYEAIHELIRELTVFHAVRNAELFEHEVVKRECDQCTGFGRGVAVAHAWYDGIDKVIIGLGISREGIDYGSFDGEPVNLLFLIASPERMQNDYLTSLSALVKLLRQSAFRQRLISASTEKDAFAFLSERFFTQLEIETSENR
jgi:mannitol/fructose-specific phosphotransferase system IIA component (Ntr-type)